MTKFHLHFAGIAGILIGLLSIISGSAVLLGIKQPDYNILRWLVIYNVTMGVVSIGVGIGIWSVRLWAIRIASYIASAHIVVLVILIIMYVSTVSVALQSIGAMSFRAVLLGLFFALTPFIAQEAETYHQSNQRQAHGQMKG